MLYMPRDVGPIRRYSDFRFIALHSFAHILPTQCSTSDVFTILNIDYTRIRLYTALSNNGPNSIVSSTTTNDCKTPKLDWPMPTVYEKRHKNFKD